MLHSSEYRLIKGPRKALLALPGERHCHTWASWGLHIALHIYA